LQIYLINNLWSVILSEIRDFPPRFKTWKFITGWK